MDAKQIAILKAETLDRLSNWGRYSRSTSFLGRLDSEEEEEEEEDFFIKCEAMTTRLAMSRARQTSRDYETTLIQVKLEVAIELAKILAPTLHPAFTGTDAVKIEEDGQVCGICLEDIEKGGEARAMGLCRHRFHDFCIFEWVKRKRNCPLCRCKLETTKLNEFCF